MMQTRRHFMQQVAGTTVLAAFPFMAGAAPDDISLGFSLYGMKTLSLDKALKTCAETGFRNVELTLNPGYPTEPKLLSADARKALRDNMASLKLEMSGLMLNLSLTVDDQVHAKNLDTLKEAAQFGSDLLSPSRPLIETVLGGKPLEWDSVKDRMAERLKEWAAVAEKAEVLLAVKAHVGSAVNTPERLMWLLQKVDSRAVKVAYDYSHFKLQGIGLDESMKLLLPHTRFIHVKDAAGDAKKFQFLLPGDGDTDYSAYFGLLKKYGYKGPVVVEVSGQVFNKPGYDPVVAARKCYSILNAALAKA
ncbi:MAG: hypothetical protein A2283_15035 [Lentisphaerae bacterium RIFOXYA12_FULL_48_11]|nr:MAG: hypothetical protein A2283_15035 [Lentisphaerae bacterium RIFOXYA12_FULL_48_11]